jgi:hypothetical protein
MAQDTSLQGIRAGADRKAQGVRALPGAQLAAVVVLLVILAGIWACLWVPPS